MDAAEKDELESVPNPVEFEAKALEATKTHLRSRKR